MEIRGFVGITWVCVGGVRGCIKGFVSGLEEGDEEVDLGEGEVGGPGSYS